MTSRNLTEVFIIMRNNASKNRNLYSDNIQSDAAERLLAHSLRDTEEGLEMRDDYGTPPVWIDKLEEAQYTLSKIKPKLDELGSLHARHLLQPTFDENYEEETEIQNLSQEISKLITSAHRHIQCIRSSLGIGTKMEQRLTENVVTCLLLQLQELTFKFRNSQSAYIRQLNSREERSQKYFENKDFTNIDLVSGSTDDRGNYVETFDNFLQPMAPVLNKTTSKMNHSYLYDEASTQQIDEDFQRPVSNRMTQQQLLLFEEENTRLAMNRDEEVAKVVRSIYDLNDIFKDLSQMVQEQGTVLDRIDYNVEQTQTRVSEGLRQLQRAEAYQRKNRKMCIIMVLAAVTLFMLILLIFTKL
ncbi:PREDICTED: syntaxin-16 [Rhagoletis zephyria]|uniref:syntaxin-16 n=1 Tax=Rhagoletis zephyria TaxID=28612 RepID=UPI00081176F3|nr:PREDICTED: syntaxin-16 [Rhagoletis zephyria]